MRLRCVPRAPGIHSEEGPDGGQLCRPPQATPGEAQRAVWTLALKTLRPPWYQRPPAGTQPLPAHPELRLWTLPEVMVQIQAWAAPTWKLPLHSSLWEVTGWGHYSSFTGGAPFPLSCPHPTSAPL